MNKLLLYCFCLLPLSSCIKASNDAKTEKAHQPETVTFEKILGSDGVVSFISSDANLQVGFELLNADGSKYATIIPGSDEIIIESKKYSLSLFANNDGLKKNYSFFPRHFSIDNYVIQYELVAVKDSLIEIYLDKAHKVTKYLKKNDAVFKVENWRDHCRGAMIDFDLEKNPIKLDASDASDSVQLDDGTDVVFIGGEVRGEWIFIQCSNVCEIPCPQQSKLNGWIRWTDGKQMIIKLFYSC